MSKYNLTDIHKGIIKESMSRGGTVKDSFYNIANIADDIDGQNIGKDTYPIYVQRLGPSADEKTYEEFAIRYGEGKDDRFNIYDYKFGEDPTGEDNYQEEYPFSLGIPTGNRDAKQWAEKLGFDVSDSMFEDLDSADSIDESKTLEDLAKRLGISVEDLEARVNKFQSAERGAINTGSRLSVAESSVDETEFGFFKTILDGRYKEEQIEDYLKSDDYEAAQDEFKLDDTYTSDWVQEFANYFDSRMDEAAIKEPIELQDALERYSFGEILDTAAEFYTQNGEKEVAKLATVAASKFRKMLDDLDGLEENQLKEHFQRFLKDYQ
jgi:hypothetical protein